ncbi:MAG: arginase [Alphaproteobacteria bacterium]|nr:arginase [Alphaproteobacteria bacterium]
MKTTAFIGFSSGWGAQVRETEKGPLSFYDSDVLSSLSLPWVWQETLLPIKTAQEVNLPPGDLTLPYIEDMCRRISSSIEEALRHQQFPVVIGGDHTVAAGTWPGVVHHLKAKQKFGLIWIDAHMDAHTMETSFSHAYHGMPLAMLLGFGEPSMCNLLEEGPVLNPQHVCLIGVRSYEEGEAALLQRLGVRIYFMKEVEERGFKAVFQEALQLVKKETKGFGLSIDLDGFDPDEAPGVGSPAPHGLKAQEVLPVLSMVRHDRLLKALEIVEYNPDLDKDEKTLFLMKDLLLTLLLKNEEKS